MIKYAFTCYTLGAVTGLCTCVLQNTSVITFMYIRSNGPTCAHACSCKGSPPHPLTAVSNVNKGVVSIFVSPPAVIALRSREKWRL